MCRRTVPTRLVFCPLLSALLFCQGEARPIWHLRASCKRENASPTKKRALPWLMTRDALPPSSTTFVLCSVVDPQNELVISLPLITASSLRTRVGSRQPYARGAGTGKIVRPCSAEMQTHNIPS